MRPQPRTLPPHPSAPPFARWTLAICIWAVSHDSTVSLDEIAFFVRQTTAVNVTKNMVWYWLRRLGMTHKVVWVVRPRPCRRSWPNGIAAPGVGAPAPSLPAAGPGPTA